MKTQKVSLEEQRHLLQQQLRAQRQHILLQLDPPSGISDHYPRSMTMRFLSGRKGLVLLTQLAAWRLGSHLPAAILATKTFIKLFSAKKK